MIDANFKNKHKAKKYAYDPDLAKGLAYFVEDGPYKEHLKQHNREVEVSRIIIIMVQLTCDAL